MSNTSEFRVYHSLWCGCWPDLVTLRLQSPFQPKDSHSCRFHAQRFLATEDTAGGMLPGPFVTDMSLNIMAIRMPIAGATSFYQNVQVCRSRACSHIKGCRLPVGSTHGAQQQPVRCHLFLYSLYHDCWQLIILPESASAMCMPVAAGLLAQHDQSAPSLPAVCVVACQMHIPTSMATVHPFAAFK